MRLFAKKKRLTGQIRKLRDDLQRRPSPLAFTQLADIYRELGDHEAALEIATECAERFPLNENPYLLQGEIRLERFLRDHIANDAKIAEAALTKVVRLNSHNIKAHMLLAELFYLVGCADDCRKHLRQVLTIMPTAREVQSFLRTLNVAEPADGEDLQTLAEFAEVVEENGQFANPPDRFPSTHPHLGSPDGKASMRLDMDSLKQEIVKMGAQRGVLNSVIMDRDEQVLAEFSNARSLSARQFAELINQIRTVADDASRRMDTGALVRAEIEGPTGNITVARIRNLTIAILYDDPLRPDRVWEMLQDFVARNLKRREVVRA